MVVLEKETVFRNDGKFEDSIQKEMNLSALICFHGSVTIRGIVRFSHLPNSQILNRTKVKLLHCFWFFPQTFSHGDRSVESAAFRKNWETENYYQSTKSKLTIYQVMNTCQPFIPNSKNSASMTLLK